MWSPNPHQLLFVSCFYSRSLYHPPNCNTNTNTNTIIPLSSCCFSSQAYHHPLCLCVVQWFTQPSQNTNTRSLNYEIWSLNTDENTQIRLNYKYKYTETDKKYTNTNINTHKKYTNTNTNTLCIFVFLFAIVFPATPCCQNKTYHNHIAYYLEK